MFLTPSGGSEATLVNNQAVAGLVPYESRVYFSARTGGQSASHDIANVNVTYTGDPAVVGSWSGITGLPVVPIHSMMLPNKKILFWDRAAASRTSSRGSGTRRRGRHVRRPIRCWSCSAPVTRSTPRGA